MASKTITPNLIRASLPGAERGTSGRVPSDLLLPSAERLSCSNFGDSKAVQLLGTARHWGLGQGMGARRPAEVQACEADPSGVGKTATRSNDL